MCTADNVHVQCKIHSQMSLIPDCELQVWKKSYKHSLGTKKCLKDEKPEKNRCNAFICSDVPVDKLHLWLRALENFWQKLWLVQWCLQYVRISVCYSGAILVVMLQEQQDCYNLLLATLDVILDKLRHGETSQRWIAFYPAAICILHWWVLPLTS